MYKLIPGTPTALTVTNNFQRSIEIFFPNENEFVFMSSFKETPAYWKKFSYNSLVLVKESKIFLDFVMS